MLRPNFTCYTSTRPGDGSQSTCSLQLLLEIVGAEGLQVIVATDVLPADPGVGHAALGLRVGNFVLVEALLEGVLNGGTVTFANKLPLLVT